MEKTSFGKFYSVVKVQFGVMETSEFWSKLKYIKMKTPINKFLYIGFLFLGIYQAVFNQDYMQAAASHGIALAFDPFNPEQKWNDRPFWQKAVLIIHLVLVATMFVLGIGLNDK